MSLHSMAPELQWPGGHTGSAPSARKDNQAWRDFIDGMWGWDFKPLLPASVQTSLYSLTPICPSDLGLQTAGAKGCSWQPRASRTPVSSLHLQEAASTSLICTRPVRTLLAPGW